MGKIYFIGEVLLPATAATSPEATPGETPSPKTSSASAA